MTRKKTKKRGVGKSRYAKRKKPTQRVKALRKKKKARGWLVKGSSEAREYMASIRAGKSVGKRKGKKGKKGAGRYSYPSNLTKEEVRDYREAGITAAEIRKMREGVSPDIIDALKANNVPKEIVNRVAGMNLSDSEQERIGAGLERLMANREKRAERINRARALAVTQAEKARVAKMKTEEEELYKQGFRDMLKNIIGANAAGQAMYNMGRWKP